MNSEAKAKIGQWYESENNDKFEVVAIDDDEGTIEIQYFDGTVEEIEVDEWNELQFIAIEPPEDWTGSYDIDRDDYGVDLESALSNENRNPLEEFDQ